MNPAGFVVLLFLVGASASYPSINLDEGLKNLLIASSDSHPPSKDVAIRRFAECFVRNGAPQLLLELHIIGSTSKGMGRAVKLCNRTVLVVDIYEKCGIDAGVTEYKEFAAELKPFKDTAKSCDGVKCLIPKMEAYYQIMKELRESDKPKCDKKDAEYGLYKELAGSCEGTSQIIKLEEMKVDLCDTCGAKASHC